MQVTAISMRALQLYAPPVDRGAYRETIERAAAFIAKGTADSHEGRVFQLLGLHWSGADPAVIQKAARVLMSEQRPDGGWAQLPTLASDAYASGQTLFAVAETGAVPPGDPAFRRGVRYLLKTQFEDGSWHVRTRAVPLQPHFETGFPFGPDQFISAAATNWATLALVKAARSGS